jgi:choline dehydrogenase-like flavoprotein
MAMALLVYPAHASYHSGIPTLRNGETRPFGDQPVRRGELPLMAVHPLGTARAGADPAASVVDGSGRVHGVSGVHVLDEAMVPSALGVNPQITIMALATRAAFALLGAPAPDEPAPERMAVPRPATPVAA